MGKMNENWEVGEKMSLCQDGYEDNLGPWKLSEWLYVTMTNERFRTLVGSIPATLIQTLTSLTVIPLQYMVVQECILNSIYNEFPCSVKSRE